jgi:hypothetical protein
MFLHDEFIAFGTWFDGAARRHRLAVRTRVDELLEALAAPAAAEIAELAHRTRYVESVAALRAHLDAAARLVERLVSSGPALLATNIAVASGVISWHRRRIVSVADLRNIARRDPRARMALACLGEVDWSTADRPVRAAFVLGEIVRHMRDGG